MPVTRRIVLLNLCQNSVVLFRCRHNERQRCACVWKRKRERYPGFQLAPFGQCGGRSAKRMVASSSLSLQPRLKEKEERNEIILSKSIPRLTLYSSFCVSLFSFSFSFSDSEESSRAKSSLSSSLSELASSFSELTSSFSESPNSSASSFAFPALSPLLPSFPLISSFSPFSEMD